MTEAVRDGFVPGSFTPLAALAGLLAGALLALLGARLLGARAPRLAAGGGLVLLLVAVLRALSDAADVLSPDEPGPYVVLLALLVLAGLAAGTLAEHRGGTGVVVAAVVLAHLALFAPYGSPSRIDFSTGELPPEWLAWLRVGLSGALAAGALAAVRPSARAAAAGVAGLLVVEAAYPLLDSAAVHAVAAGAALAVLLPVLVRSAPQVGSGSGLLLGVVLVLGAVVADDALSDAQAPDLQPELGLEVVPNDAYLSRLELDLDRSPLVPSFGRIPRDPLSVPG